MAAMNLELNQAGWHPCGRTSRMGGKRGNPFSGFRRAQNSNLTAGNSGPAIAMMAWKRIAAQSGHEVPAGV